MCFDFELFLSVVVVYCIGVLLINFGMFDVFMLCVVWCYLVEFLLDLWVVEILQVVWQVLLCMLILLLCGCVFVKKYVVVWMFEGLLLCVYIECQIDSVWYLFMLNGYYVMVDYVMCYGSLNILYVFVQFKCVGVECVLLMLMYL